MRTNSASTWRMGKRKTAELDPHEPAAAGKKRAKKGEDPCGRFLSLVAKQDTVIAGLTYFLTTSLRDEGSPSIVEVYLQRCPECEHILQPLQWGKERRTQDVLLLCFQCLEQVLLFTASTDDHRCINSSAGSKLVRSILRNHMRPVYSSLVTTAPMILIAACLKLLAAMVAQGPRSARELQQTFNFGYKPLEFLPHKSHHIHGTDDSVRLCFIKFALSFLVIGGDHVIRAILELKGFLSAIFKLLPKDPVETVHFVLSTLMQRVVQNSHISKKLKSLFFSQYVLKQIAQLLMHLGKEEQNLLVAGGASESVSLRQFVFQFLLKLCTDFQFGICYRSKEIPLGLERTNNPVILQLLLSLSGSVATNSLAQDLTVRTVSTCPDLLLSYLRSTSFSYEPSPTSKWVKMMEFLIRLFSALPPVPQVMAMDETHLPSSSHLSIDVQFTLPMVTSRSMLSQGIQNATPLVRFETLTLMQLVLKRATAVVEHCRAQERGIEVAGSYCVQYCDAVLKSLPDIKTVIALRQQLLGGGTPARMNTDSMSLTPDEIHKNTELSESNSLLTLTVAVMQGYQKLFPAIFAQADFSVAKLIPSPSCVDRALSCDSEVLVSTLQLLLDTPPDGLMWQQQGAVTLSNILWLYLTGSEEVTKVALKLVLKLLLGTDAFRGHGLDLQIVLSALKAHHRTVTLNSTEETHCLVSFVSNIFLAAVRDPYTHLENVDRALLEGGGVKGHVEGVQHYSLKNITDAPLKMLSAQSTEVCNKCSKKACGSIPAAVACPLVPCLLSQFAEMKPGPLSLFVSATLVRLFLVQESYEVFARVVVHHLGLQAVKERYLSSCWSGLYTSLLQFFSAWLPHHIGKTREYETEATAKLSAKKVQKTIQNMSANAEEIFELLSSLRADDFVRFLPSTMGTKGLQHILVHHASIRPMGIVGSADDPHVASLLESLPFTSILIQSISNQLIPNEQLSHSTALSYLLEALNSLELRELLTRRLEMALGDHLELVCSVNAILKLLEMIYIPGKDVYITGNQRITLEFFFELLTRVNLKACSDRVCLQTQTSADVVILPSLLSVIFGSCVIKDAFLSEFAVTKDQHSVCQARRGKGKGSGTSNMSSLNADCTFSQGVGDLVVLALEHCEQFRRMPEFCHLAERVFTVCENLMEVSSPSSHAQSELVLCLLKKMKPYLDENRLIAFSEKIILSVQPGSDPSVDFFTDILETVLLAGQSSESPESMEGETQGVRVLNISDPAVTRLVELTSELGSEKLDHIVYSLLVTKIHQSNDSLCSLKDFNLSCTTYQANSQTDDCVVGLKSLVKNLITPTNSMEQLSHVVEARPNCLAIHSAFDSRLSSGCSETDTEKRFSALHKTVQDKSLFTVSDCDKLLHLHDQANHPSFSSWLSKTVLIKLLHYCLGDLNTVRAQMVAVLLKFDVAFEYFSMSALQQLCERTKSESDHRQLQVCLYVLEQYLSIADRRQKGSRLCDFCKKAVKAARRRLWSKCSFLVADGLSPLDLQGTCSHILQLLCCLSSKARKQFKKLCKCWKDDEHWNIHQLLLGVQVACLAADSHLSQLVVSRAVGKLTEMLAKEGVRDQGSGDEEDKLVNLTCKLLHEHIEGVLSVSGLGCFVQHALRLRFMCAQTLQLLAALVRCVYGSGPTSPRNGFSLETMYEMVWSHSEFLTVMCSLHDNQEGLVKVKEQLVGLLVTVVELQPSVSKSSHLTVLLGAYSATSSLADRGLLFLLALYEQNGESLGDYRPFLWGPAALEQYKIKQEVGWLLWKQPGTQEVIELLDREMLDHSTREFPLDLELEPVNLFLVSARESENTGATPLYDPCFLLPLFSHLLDSNCVVDCRQFIDCGCLGYIVVSLSSRVETMRAAGSHALSRFTMHLEGARFKEKPQIVMLIEVIRNSLEVKNARLPSLFAVFAAKVARLFLYPEKDLYPLIARFVAAKPSMDLSDIPLYYSMMHSSSAQCFQEQVWMLRLLVDGLRCEDDYHLYRKRKVFAHAMAIFNSPFVGKESKSIILEIILNACSIPLVAIDLVWNQGLLTWLQQLGIAKRDPLTVLCQTSLKEQSKDKEIQPSTNLPPLFEEELTLTV